jgi:hypothetical protein
VSVWEVSEPDESLVIHWRRPDRGTAPIWTSENRPKYNRDKLRYPSDLTDDDWSHIEPLNQVSPKSQMGDDFRQALLKLSAADGRASRKGE